MIGPPKKLNVSIFSFQALMNFGTSAQHAGGWNLGYSRNETLIFHWFG
jgi:hypothetical protein